MHQLVLRTQRRRAAARFVALDHVAHQPVRLRTDVDLVPLVALDEDETSLVRLVVEAIRRLR
jgi:hypothetical protein